MWFFGRGVKNYDSNMTALSNGRRTATIATSLIGLITFLSICIESYSHESKKITSINEPEDFGLAHTQIIHQYMERILTSDEEFSRQGMMNDLSREIIRSLNVFSDSDSEYEYLYSMYGFGDLILGEEPVTGITEDGVPYGMYYTKSLLQDYEKSPELTDLVEKYFFSLSLVRIEPVEKVLSVMNNDLEAFLETNDDEEEEIIARVTYSVGMESLKQWNEELTPGSNSLLHRYLNSQGRRRELQFLPEDSGKDQFNFSRDDLVDVVQGDVVGTVEGILDTIFGGGFLGIFGAVGKATTASVVAAIRVVVIRVGCVKLPNIDTVGFRPLDLERGFCNNEDECGTGFFCDRFPDRPGCQCNETNSTECPDRCENFPNLPACSDCDSDSDDNSTAPCPTYCNLFPGRPACEDCGEDGDDGDGSPAPCPATCNLFPNRPQCEDCDDGGGDDGDGDGVADDGDTGGDTPTDCPVSCNLFPNRPQCENCPEDDGGDGGDGEDVTEDLGTNDGGGDGGDGDGVADDGDTGGDAPTDCPVSCNLFPNRPQCENCPESRIINAAIDDEEEEDLSGILLGAKSRINVPVPAPGEPFVDLEKLLEDQNDAPVEDKYSAVDDGNDDIFSEWDEYMDDDFYAGALILCQMFPTIPQCLKLAEDFNFTVFHDGWAP